MKVDIEKTHIGVKILEGEGKLKAVIKIDFGDFVIRGFRIQESQFENPKANGKKLWLTVPSYQSAGKYRPLFFMPEKTLWEELENKVWEAYEIESKRHYQKRFNLKDEDVETLETVL